MRVLINIDVPELAPAIAFYQAAAGFELKRVLDDDVAEMAYGSSAVYLLKKPGGSSPTHAKGTIQGPVRSYARHWTPVHLDVVVNDINAAVERALAAGAKRESECIDWRGSQCVTFSDPFGHGFCLIAFRGDSYG